MALNVTAPGGLAIALARAHQLHHPIECSCWSKSFAANLFEWGLPESAHSVGWHGHALGTGCYLNCLWRAFANNLNTTGSLFLLWSDRNKKKILSWCPNLKWKFKDKSSIFLRVNCCHALTVYLWTHYVFFQSKFNIKQYEEELFVYMPKVLLMSQRKGGHPTKRHRHGLLTLPFDIFFLNVLLFNKLKDVDTTSNDHHTTLLAGN